MSQTPIARRSHFKLSQQLTASSQECHVYLDQTRTRHTVHSISCHTVVLKEIAVEASVT